MRTFETERLILKPADLEDADFFLKLYNLPSFIKFIGDRNLRTKEDAEKYILNRFRPQLERLGFGNYVVIHKELNKKLAQLEFSNVKVWMFSTSDFLSSQSLKVKVTLTSLLPT